jgi:DNA-binding beta-propeller fold protein YncE
MAMQIGTGKYVYEVQENWAKLPRSLPSPLSAPLSFYDIPGLAVDSKDNVYVFTRTKPPIMIFDRDGNFLDSWGDNIFSVPHSVRIGPDGLVYCVDCGDHTIRKLTPKGEVLLTIGTKGKASDSGYDGSDYRTIKRGAEPFNTPTDIAFAPNGDLYISDGYGNARIHRFSKEGELLNSWGEPGEGKGQFNLSHGIWIDKQKRILAADRENSRIQLFSLEGEYIDEWRDSNRPALTAEDRDGVTFTTEMGYAKEMLYAFQTPPADRVVWPRLTIRSPEGRIIGELGGKDRCAPGNFFAPHAVCLDSRGDLYVGEITSLGPDPNCHRLQKLVRRRG